MVCMLSPKITVKEDGCGQHEGSDIRMIRLPGGNIMEITDIRLILS